MKLTKNQSLELIKTLSHYQIVCETSRIPYLHSPEFLALLHAFVIDEPVEPAIFQSSIRSVSENIDVRRVPPEESATESYVLGTELHGLKPVEAKVIGSSVATQDDEVMLEFECTPGRDLNVTDLLISGMAINNVTFVRRTEENELLVAEHYNGDLAWHRFYVPKFPEGWTELLPVEDLIEIE